MNQKTFVTLGVCVKNSAPIIDLTLRSIIAQDYPHKFMELIIVDGLSSDGTVGIIKKWLKQSDIQIKFFTENTGLGFARQMVVDNSSGKYVVWVDGDMVLPTSHVSRQVAFLDNHPSVAIGRAKYGIWQESGPIAFLENIPFVVESSKSHEAVPIGICGPKEPFLESMQCGKLAVLMLIFKVPPRILNS
jgi:glycosyltransferase involved in cell wall biosynthesis